VIEGRRTHGQALQSYHAFSAAHGWKFALLLRLQRTVPRIAPRLLGAGLRAMQAKRFLDWSFGQYLNIAHPAFVGTGAGTRTARLLAA
jgi:hypothetical protein